MRDDCSRNDGFQPSGRIDDGYKAVTPCVVTFRLGRLAPTDSHLDRGTTGPGFSSQGLPDRFRRLDLQHGRRAPSNERALFAASPYPADGMTCDQLFPATAFL